MKTELHRRAETTTETTTDGDDRTTDQRRADALCDLFGDTPAGGGPQINVTVPLAVLTGTSDEPGELQGHGPIPAALARAIAHDPTGT